MSDSIGIIDSDEGFRALRAEWTALAARAVDSNTFLTHDWLYSWWMAYRPDARLAIVTVRRAGQLVAVAPMMLMRQGTIARLLRRVRFIGDGTSETDHMNFIVDEQDRQGLMAILLDALNRLPWDVAHFSQLPEVSANLAQLLEYAATHGWLVSRAQVPCPRRSLPSTFDELLRTLPSRLRTALRSSRRQLNSQYTVDFGQVKRREELPAALEALYRNHTGRWQARGEGGVFASPQKRAFYASLSDRLLEAGSLRFFYLKLDGRTVAQQYCFEHRGTVMLLQEGFDFDFAKLNVGNVLRSMVFEWMIENRLGAYDFLAGTSRHKQSWSDSVPNDIDVRACRPTFVGRAAHTLPRLLRQARSATKARDAELVE